MRPKASTRRPVLEASKSEHPVDPSRTQKRAVHHDSSGHDSYALSVSLRRYALPPAAHAFEPAPHHPPVRVKIPTRVYGSIGAVPNLETSRRPGHARLHADGLCHQVDRCGIRGTNLGASFSRTESAGGRVGGWWVDGSGWRLECTGWQVQIACSSVLDRHFCTHIVTLKLWVYVVATQLSGNF